MSNRPQIRKDHMSIKSRRKYKLATKTRLVVYFVVLLTAVGLTFISHAALQSTVPAKNRTKHNEPPSVPGEILVRFRATAKTARLTANLSDRAQVTVYAKG